jgi:hypothetical protein
MERIARRRRLGWLGPAIVGLGAAIAAVGVYLILVGRPVAGVVIDRIELGDGRTFVIRSEVDGERDFVELMRADGELAWRALIPPYAGRPGAPGIAWGHGTVTVRVIRDGRAEVFALALGNAAKLGGFKLAPGKGPVVKQAVGPVTLTDHVRAYEFVGGADWNQLTAIDLATGEALWKQDLGAAPVTAATIESTDPRLLTVTQGQVVQHFEVVTGTRNP